MKKIVFLVAMLGSLSAFASNPGVGSYSLYQVSGPGLSGEYKIEITAFSEELNQFTQTYTKTFNGVTTVEHIQLKANQVNTKEMNERTLEFCEKLGGQQEVVTVPAGTFNSCKTSNSNILTTYSGPVPFGFVKGLSGNISFELLRFEYKN